VHTEEFPLLLPILPAEHPYVIELHDPPPEGVLSHIVQ
jgi:hypothetical protein